MFIKRSFADEIARNMESALNAQDLAKASAREMRLVKAAAHLNRVAEIFDELGLSVEAEVTTRLLEATASGEQMTTETHPGHPGKKYQIGKQTVRERHDNELADDSDDDLEDNNCAMCGSDKNKAKDDSFPDDAFPEFINMKSVLDKEEDPLEFRMQSLLDGPISRPTVEDIDWDVDFSDNSELDQDL